MIATLAPLHDQVKRVSHTIFVTETDTEFHRVPKRFGRYHLSRRSGGNFLKLAIGAIDIVPPTMLVILIKRGIYIIVFSGGLHANYLIS